MLAASFQAVAPSVGLTGGEWWEGGGEMEMEGVRGLGGGSDS